MRYAFDFFRVRSLLFISIIVIFMSSIIAPIIFTIFFHLDLFALKHANSRLPVFSFCACCRLTVQKAFDYLSANTNDQVPLTIKKFTTRFRSLRSGPLLSNTRHYHWWINQIIRYITIFFQSLWTPASPLPSSSMQYCQLWGGRIAPAAYPLTSAIKTELSDVCDVIQWRGKLPMLSAGCLACKVSKPSIKVQYWNDGLAPLPLRFGCRWVAGVHTVDGALLPRCILWVVRVIHD